VYYSLEIRCQDLISWAKVNWRRTWDDGCNFHRGFYL